MHDLLAELNLTAETAPPGLVKVTSPPSSDIPLDEQIAIRQASQFSPAPDFVFFRRFSDARSSQVAAYVVDNSHEQFDVDSLRQLHHKLWLSGAAALLYIAWSDRVDILTCAAGKSVKRNLEWKYDPIATLRTVSDVSDALVKRYSAYRLSDGTFWEDAKNANAFNRKKSAHKVLIDKVKQADRDLGGKDNLTARRLLLLTLLIKYLEDRGVFPDGWFSKFHPNARSFYHVLTSANVKSVLAMFKALENKFNGDIFVLSEEGPPIDEPTLLELVKVINPRSDASGQLYFWDIYSFEHIPVEVLSHIYQHFAEADRGAVFTPPLLVNLLLDQVLPLDGLSGTETVLDPTCGSGVFLVAAFRRLTHAWLSKNDWKKPTPTVLKRILSKSIFGIEIQDEAAHIASFSLALAVCDALMPEIIWNDLRFDKLIDQNIFIGNFGDIAEKAKKSATKGVGFDVIVGNPPFQSKLPATTYGVLKDAGRHIPDKQIAYYILEECIESLLAENGNACLIQPAGIVYNTKTASYRHALFSRATLLTVLDFVSVRGMFNDADTKIVAIQAKKAKPSPDHVVSHWTFRRSFATESQILFELDHYDQHQVSQQHATSLPWIWRTGLLGGGRLVALAKRIVEFETIEDFIESKGWSAGEGFNPTKKENKAPVPWLYKGMPYLPPSFFTSDTIDPLSIIPLANDRVEAPRTKERYSPPLFLIKENDDLNCAIWEKDHLAYNNSIVGISSPRTDSAELKSFRSAFIRSRKELRASLYLLGTRILTSKATSLLKSEITKLPWPVDGSWDFVPWEKELVDDLATYMADYVRLGQDSALLQKAPSVEDMDSYCSTFLRLMRTSFPNVYPCGDGRSEGLRFQAFCFSEQSTVEWINESEWLSHLRTTVFRTHGQAIRSVRIVRLYEANTLILIKPDLLRYWIRSAAIQDVDGTVTDILANG